MYHVGMVTVINAYGRTQTIFTSVCYALCFVSCLCCRIELFGVKRTNNERRLNKEEAKERERDDVVVIWYILCAYCIL